MRVCLEEHWTLLCNSASNKFFSRQFMYASLILEIATEVIYWKLDYLMQHQYSKKCTGLTMLFQLLSVHLDLHLIQNVQQNVKEAFCDSSIVFLWHQSADVHVRTKIITCLMLCSKVSCAHIAQCSIDSLLKILSDLVINHTN